MVAGIVLSLAIAAVAWFLGGLIPVLGAPLLAIVIGMALSSVAAKYQILKSGIDFTGKKLLQFAIVMLGLGLNLTVIAQVGREALLVILLAVITGLLVAFIGQKIMRLPGQLATLIGVGSAICGGSAIAATAPVVQADDDEVASAISVVVFFNVLAVFIFPLIGVWAQLDPHQFGILAGAAINDTSSVTAAAATWDNTHQLGTATLDTAVTVKLIRTLAIIPITLGLSIWQHRAQAANEGRQKFRIAIPQFILWFVAAAVVASLFQLPVPLIAGARLASRFLIVTAMAAIGLKTNPVRLVKSARQPLLLGFACSLAIAIITLRLVTG